MRWLCVGLHTTIGDQWEERFEEVAKRKWPAPRAQVCPTALRSHCEKKRTHYEIVIEQKPCYSVSVLVYLLNFNLQRILCNARMMKTHSKSLGRDRIFDSFTAATV